MPSAKWGGGEQAKAPFVQRVLKLAHQDFVGAVALAHGGAALWSRGSKWLNVAEPATPVGFGETDRILTRPSALAGFTLDWPEEPANIPVP